MKCSNIINVLPAAKLIELLGEITRLCDDSFLSAKREFEKSEHDKSIRIFKRKLQRKKLPAETLRMPCTVILIILTDVLKNIPV